MAYSVGTLCGDLCKTAEPIEMPFGLWAQMSPWNHVLDCGSDPPMGKGNFEWKRAAYSEV